MDAALRTPLLDLFKRGEVGRDLRLLAAQGALAPRAHEQVSLLLLLANDGGQWWVLSFIVVVVLVDVGAYATGLNFGKHPMAPTISPKKTWEGLAGAVAAALVGGVLLAIFALDQPWWFGLIFGAVIAATATAGDLSESLLKRDIGIKDMSSWLPGHGGFLDRLDSILPSAAAAYVLWFVFAS